MKNRFLSVILAVLAAAAVAFTAAAEEAAADAEELMVIGEDPTGQDYGFVISNETGKAIEGIALRTNYGEFGDNLLTEDEKIDDKEKVQFFCAPGEMVNYVPAVYDLQLTFDDKSEAVLHTLPLGDADEVSVLTEKDITYIRFTSKSLNYETDTLRRETEISEIGEQVLIADYNAKITYVDTGSWSGGGDGGGGDGGNGGGDGCLTDGLLF